MKPVHIVQGTAVPLDRSDVDTDQIIPSDWLKRVERTGFEKGLFSEWRDDPNFVMNQDEYLGAKVLVAGANFGTGSSREHAVWAIQQYGFEAVVSPRFGPIFKNNSTKNGLVAVEGPKRSANNLWLRFRLIRRWRSSSTLSVARWRHRRSTWRSASICPTLCSTGSSTASTTSA